jgi:hypothetical protein
LRNWALCVEERKKRERGLGWWEQYLYSGGAPLRDLTRCAAIVRKSTRRPDASWSAEGRSANSEIFFYLVNFFICVCALTDCPSPTCLYSDRLCLEGECSSSGTGVLLMTCVFLGIKWISKDGCIYARHASPCLNHNSK